MVQKLWEFSINKLHKIRLRKSNLRKSKLRGGLQFPKTPSSFGRELRPGTRERDPVAFPLE